MVLNFSDYDRMVDVPFSSNGIWQELLEGGEVVVHDYVVQGHRVPSNWGRVFYHKE